METVDKYRELRDEFNALQAEIGSELSDVINGVRKKMNDKIENNSKVKIPVKSCGVIERQPFLHKSEQIVAENAVDKIIRQVKDNPIDFPELAELTGHGKYGRGSGDLEGRLQIINISTPPFIKGIGEELKLFRERSKTKDYYDEVSLVRGLTRKKKVKKAIRKKTLFVLMDTSGSMWGFAFKGVPLLTIMASYIPPMAREFEGEFWTIDDGAPSTFTPLKKLRREQIKSIPIKGGGGTNFDESFAMLNAKKNMIVRGDPSSEHDFMTILLSDGIVSWDLDIVPENFLFVTPDLNEYTDENGRNRNARIPNFLHKNQKTILITGLEEVQD